jgi:hypothetical protein
MTRFTLGLTLCLAASGCSVASYQPRPLQLDREVEIDDEDIRKAFEAKPQMPAKMTVAFFSLGSQDERTLGPGATAPGPPAAGEQNDAALAAMLARLPGVEDVYRVPAVAVTGERRFASGPGAYGAPPPQELSIKKLRLVAARAHADVLVVFDHGQASGSVNELIALAPLVVPMLFVPMFDARLESYLTAYVIDVRNGYFYGQLDASERGGEEYRTVYASDTRQEATLQWGRLVPRMETHLAALIASQRRTPAREPDPAPEPVAGRGEL